MSVRAIDSASKIPQVMVESKSNVSTQPTSPSQDTDCRMNCFLFCEDQLDHHGHRTKVTSGTGCRLEPGTRARCGISVRRGLQVRRRMLEKKLPHTHCRESRSHPELAGRQY